MNCPKCGSKSPVSYERMKSGATMNCECYHCWGCGHEEKVKDGSPPFKPIDFSDIPVVDLATGSPGARTHAHARVGKGGKA